MEQFNVLAKVYQDRMEAKAKKICLMEARLFGGKSTKSLDMLDGAVRGMQIAADCMKVIKDAMPAKEVVGCSLDVHVSIYSFLDTFADELIVAIENKEKEMKKGGEK